MLKRSVVLLFSLILSLSVFAQTPAPCNPSGKVEASRVLSVYLSSIFCQNEGLFKDCDGVYSQALADAYINNLKAAIQSNPAFAGIDLNFPADNSAIIAALQSGDCEAAGGEMTTATTGEIDVKKYNEDIRDAYDDIVNGLLPKELELSITTEQPSCSLPNGKITVSVTTGTAPYQYSKDKGANWSDETTETTYTFDDLAAGQYTITVKDSEGNEGTIGVELETAEMYITPRSPVVLATAPTANARAILSTGFCIAYTSGYDSHCYQFKIGFEFIPPSADNNYTLTISKAPDRFASVLGDYVPLFKESDPNIFLGFYKYESHSSSNCTQLSAQATIEGRCIGLLCEELLLPRSVFADQKDPGLFLKDHIEGRYTPEITAIAEEVDELVTEFMNNEQYAKLIRNVKSGTYTEQELSSLRKTLLDYKELMLNTYGEANASNLQNFINFFSCKETAKLCNTKGVVPLCWWQFSPPGSQLPFQSGFIDGAAEVVELAFDLEKFANCWLNPRNYFWGDNSDCESTRQSSLQALQFTLDLSSGDPVATIQFAAAVPLMTEILGNQYGIWENEIGACEDTYPACCEYIRGKLAFDVASLFIGIGEFQAVGKGFSLGAKMLANLRRATNMLKFIKFPARVLSLKAIRNSTGKGLIYMMLMTSLSGSPIPTGIKFAAKNIPKMVVETAGRQADEITTTFARTLENNIDDAANVLVNESDDILLKIDNAEVNVSKLQAYANPQISQDIIFGKRNNYGFEALFAYTALGLVKISPKDDSPVDCATCSPTKSLPKRLCTKLENLQQKATANGAAGVQKLCSSLTDVQLEEVADKLLSSSFSRAEVGAFLGDILRTYTNSEALNRNVANLNSDLIAAWEIVYDARNTITSPAGSGGNRQAHRSDMAVLREIVKIQNNTTYGANFMRLEGITGMKSFMKQNTRLPCNPCYTYPNGDHLNDLENYLQDLVYLTNTCTGNVAGCSSVTTALKSTARPYYRVEPEAFVIRVVRSENWANKVVAFEASMLNSRRIIDIRINDNDVTVNCEFKSWAKSADNEVAYDDGENVDASKSPFDNLVAGKGSYGQFRDYLKGIQSMDNLRYYFDGKKGVSEDYAKGKFQQMLQNTDNQTEIFNTIWANNLGLRESLFPETAGQDIEWLENNEDRIKGEFITRVSSTSNAFYNFIKVR